MRSFATTLAGVLTAAVLTAGCVKHKHETIIFPDGSGKIQIDLSVNEEIFEQMRSMVPGASEMDEPDLAAKFVENIEGVSGITTPKQQSKDGWLSASFAVYFEDINKVKIFQDGMGGRQETVRFSFKKQGEGFVLEIDDQTLADEQVERLNEMDEEQLEMAWTMVKSMFEGMELTQTITLPGTITTAEGFDKNEKRSASISYSGDKFETLDDVLKLAKITKRKVVSGRSEISEKDAQAFKKELDEAKANWPKVQAEFKKKAEEQRKKAEEDLKGGDEDE